LIQSEQQFYNELIQNTTLSLQQKIILQCDGSLTRLLEVMFNEQFELKVLHEEISHCNKSMKELALKENDEFMERKIILSGCQTKKTYLYAESVIALKHLTPQFHHALIDKSQPIGKIWEDQKVETYKNMVEWGMTKLGPAAGFFDLKQENNVLYRKYFVYSNQKPTMMITEKFPTYDSEYFSKEHFYGKPNSH